jgi:Tfp pilus assembly protein PilF
MSVPSWTVAVALAIALAGCSPEPPTDDQAAMSAGLDALYTRHDPDAAAIEFRKVLAANPNDYGATYQLAAALDAGGRQDEARPLWEKMLAFAEAAGDQQTAATARARLGQPPVETEESIMAAGLDALYQRRDPTAAVAEFQKLLARNPTHYGATFQLAAAFDAAGRPEEARPYWEKALAMAQGYADAPTAEKARARLAAPGVVSVETLMRRGLDALYAHQDPAAAAAAFRQVLDRNPAHYGATFQLASALDAAGKGAEARPLWRKMLDMAVAANDTKTADTARARLAEEPSRQRGATHGQPK